MRINLKRIMKNGFNTINHQKIDKLPTKNKYFSNKKLINQLKTYYLSNLNK